MPIAAVPAYLGKNFKDASPGMRFGMYLTLWEGPTWSKIKDRPLDAAKHLNSNDKQTMQALLVRQKQAFDAAASADATLRIEARATAPFTTGLGNEHPLQNGFAFLNPYGLPYLPGSGIKGVLRQAARELASGQWGDAQGWSEDKCYPTKLGKDTMPLSMLDILFGRESADGETDHLRGALSFWDVIPQIAGDNLAVEIMTPHQPHYYQQKAQAGSTNPHESGQPIPISFLTVPPKSAFVFHVQCNTAHLNRIAPALTESERWKTLLTTAFHHAFQWLGFGAKTAVGYGAMEEDPVARKRHQEKHKAEQAAVRKVQEQMEREEELSKLSPALRAAREFFDARPDKNLPELSVLLGSLKKGEWNGVVKSEIAQHVKQLMLKEKKWKEKSEKKNPAKDGDYQDTLKVKTWLTDQ